MNLDQMRRALGTWDVAEHIYNIDQGKSLGEALALYNEATANDENDNDDDADPLGLQQALKHRKAPTGAMAPIKDKTIKLGVNKTSVNFGGVDTRKTSKSWDNASSKVSSIQKGMSEDQLDNHRSANKELDWVDPERDRATASKVKMIKDACRKSREAREQDNPYKLSPVVESILSKKAAESRALKEATTVAARTLATHKVNEPSVRDRLPDTFKQSGLLPVKAQPNVDNATRATTQLPTTDDVAIRMPDFDVRKSLPAEWQDAKTAALAKQKAGQLKTWNDAATSSDHQPNHEKSPADDQQEYDRNTNIPFVDGMTRTTLPQPNVKGRTPNYAFPDGKKNFPMKQKQPSTSTDLLNPRDVSASNMNV